MKKYRLLLSIFFLNCFAQAQLPAWDWAIKATTTKAQAPIAICVDGEHNGVYTVGYNAGLALFNTSVTDSGSFLLKHDLNGAPVWAKSIPGTPTEIKKDTLGNIYVLGNFKGTAFF